MCETGTASSMWPMRSRRTRASVTSTPQRSQITPLCLMRLYFPQEHSQSRVGPKMRSQKQAALFRFERAVIDRLRIFDFALAPGPHGVAAKRRRSRPDRNHGWRFFAHQLTPGMFVHDHIVSKLRWLSLGKRLRRQSQLVPGTRLSTVGRPDLHVEA